MKVTTEAEATPLVRIFAVKFAAALQQSSYVSLLKKTAGTFSLKSKTDPQAITVKVARDEVHITSGVDKAADIVIHINFNKPNDRPKVDGLIRHPLYAMAIGKLLEFPEINWADALRSLWDQHKDYPGMPDGITAKSLDEDRQLSVGSSTEPVYLEGQSADLAEVFLAAAPYFSSCPPVKLKAYIVFNTRLC